MIKKLPTPYELWGDCTIVGWASDEKEALFKLWLKNIAILIIFAEQVVIDRVGNVVKETVAKAKAGEISTEQALRTICPTNIISAEEWEVINTAAREYGPKFYSYFGGKAGNN